MSKEKIPSLSKSVSATIGIMFGLPIFWWFFLDFPIPEMSEETGRKFSQIGLLINFIAALSMVGRYLWLNKYNKRLEVIYQIDKLVALKYEFLKHDTYDELSREQAIDQFRKEQAPLYEELENYLNFDKVESIHMFIGIVGLCIGTFFQLLGVG